ncbi:MAG: transglutaminase family protein [Verrucomicrobiae bacterium]|nr:transglutaminase family protein [Verrucomicrobiae bacterium]
MKLQIDHSTRYHYSQPVSFGTHRLMIRPLEGHDIQIISSGLNISPACRIRWMHDVFNNSIAQVTFTESAPELVIDSQVVVEQFNTNPFDFELDPTAIEYPFSYADTEKNDIAPYLLRQHPEDDPAILEWVKPFRGIAPRINTQEFLIALNRSVPLFFTYNRREEPGVQSPGQTLQSRSGSCRDFALLFIETARMLGIAARFVSGYLAQVSTQAELVAAGATHAWAEVYLPGAGWKGFDPTCGILAAENHVRVAVARVPSQAIPVTGSFIGAGNLFSGMKVDVMVRKLS